ncbi:hypothetical protein Pan216_06310 [Planctomycetes bacterium Pan216]|uniref:Uncharacterized protein n=1 Tax=Kolteria novifilia TaxID=2527975 RepID=A0A518AYJ3_9BACT|nr:hypothetical protein Pan216_06310 [Planctomycetes bacterium Pan216]
MVHAEFGVLFGESSWMVPFEMVCVTAVNSGPWEMETRASLPVGVLGLGFFGTIGCEAKFSRR